MEQSFYNCAQNVVDDGNPVVCTIFVSFVCYLILFRAKNVPLRMDVQSVGPNADMHEFCELLLEK